jgi:hypothetical protein
MHTREYNLSYEIREYFARICASKTRDTFNLLCRSRIASMHPFCEALKTRNQSSMPSQASSGDAPRCPKMFRKYSKLISGKNGRIYKKFPFVPTTEKMVHHGETLSSVHVCPEYGIESGCPQLCARKQALVNLDSVQPKCHYSGYRRKLKI